MKDTKKFLLLSILFAANTIFAADVSQSQLDMLDQLPPDQRASILLKMESQAELTKEIEKAFGKNAKKSKGLSF